MATLQKNTIRVINFAIEEGADGEVTVTNIHVQGTDLETDELVNITSLTPEQKELLVRDVLDVIKQQVRYIELTS